MKKKVKLFATIASLCLAVCLMAFGVWAANTATLSITSTVSYTVSDNVHVKFDVSVKYTEGALKYTSGTDASPTSTTASNIVTNTWTTIEQKPEATDDQKSHSLNLGSYAFELAAVASSYVEYTIVVTNAGAYTAEITVTGLPEAKAYGAITISTTGTGTLDTTNKATINAAGTFTIVVKYSLTDKTVDSSAPTFNPSINVAQKSN